MRVLGRNHAAIGPARNHSPMPNVYTEDKPVEQPASGLFAELGWQVALPPPHPASPSGQLSIPPSLSG